MDGLNGVSAVDTDAAAAATAPSSAPTDTVKLFVGQVPRHMTEEQLLPMFQEAGNVQEIIIIKDKATKASRGCCFVIYQRKQEADNAIAIFHNKRKLPPLSTPMQVKYAEGELERLEHKLFIGMLPKTVTEADLEAVFSPFGTIKELTVIKGSQASKGCAFVKYETKEQAIAAIKALNDTYKMEGSTTALVVKWADTEKEKQARKQQRPQTTPTVPLQQTSAYGFVPGSYPVTTPLNGYGAQNPYGLPQYSTPLMGQSPVPGPMMGATNTVAPPPSVGYDMTASAAPVLNAGYPTNQQPAYNHSAFQNMQPYQSVHQPSFPPQGNVPALYQGGGLPNAGLGSAAAVPTKTPVPPQAEGPPGANLFIYHLPPDFGDHDLNATFQPFGNVVSSKVYVDKHTGLSKCFGFVSYDSPASAQAAINAMHGAHVRGKRLKVQLKRDNRQNKPY